MSVTTKNNKSFLLDTSLFRDIADCQDKRLANDNRELEELLNYLTGIRRGKEDYRTYLFLEEVRLLKKCSKVGPVQELCQKILAAAGISS